MTDQNGPKRGLELGSGQNWGYIKMASLYNRLYRIALDNISRRDTIAEI